MQPEKDETQILHEQLEENKRLLEENNGLLRKMLRRSSWAMFLRVVWVLIILGAPVALYYYVIDPYFDTVGESLRTLNEGLSSVPGWSQFMEAINPFSSKE
jgi:hypothetical protein